MKAYVFITVAPGRCTDVVTTVRRVAGVKSADVCWGLPDIVVLVEAADATTLQKVVLDKIQQITGVNQTATHIIFE
jgi:DNA-binding Lrp family transcriptional regulator